MAELFDIMFQDVSPTKVERSLLEYFLRRPNDVVSKEQLLEDVWGYKSNTKTRTVVSTLERLRKKLDESTIAKLETVWSKGYTLSLAGVDRPMLTDALKPIVDANPNAWAMALFIGAGSDTYNTLVELLDTTLVRDALSSALSKEILSQTATELLAPLKSRELLTPEEVELLRSAGPYLVLDTMSVEVIRKQMGVSLPPKIAFEILIDADAVDPSAQAYRCACLGFCSFMMNELAQMKNWFAQMESFLNQTDDTLVADLLCIYGWSLAGLNQYPEAKAIYKRAFSKAVSASDKGLALYGMGGVLVDERDVACLVVFEDALTVYRESDNDEMASLVIIAKATFLALTDNCHDAKLLLDQLEFADLPIIRHYHYVLAQALVYLRVDPVRCVRWLSLVQSGQAAAQVEMNQFVIGLASGSVDTSLWQPFLAAPNDRWGAIRHIVACVALDEDPRYDVSADVVDLISVCRSMVADGDSLIDVFFEIVKHPMQTFEI